jgi:hypothetical protein
MSGLRWLAAIMVLGLVLGCSGTPEGQSPAPEVKNTVVTHKDGTTELRTYVPEEGGKK